MGVDAVFSDEKRNYPRELAYDGGKGFHCVCSEHHDEHSCDTRAIIDGTAMYVTATFGLVCAATVVNRIALPLVEKSARAKSLFEDRAAKKSDDKVSIESDV
jgi:tRNA A37 threonylcarbamoyladenosine dehydratase